MEEIGKKRCVLLDCSNEAVGVCNNCRIPVCNKHSRRLGQFFLCINCYGYTKKLRPGRLY